MKKIIIFFLLLYFLAFPAIAFGDNGDIDAGLTPDSRFYWFDRMAEKIISLFLLHPQDKVNALSKIGLERLAEAQEVEDEATVGELISEFLSTQKNIQLISGLDIDSLVDLSDDQLKALDELEELLEYGEGEIEYRAGDALSILNKILEKQLVRLVKIDLEKHPHKAKKITRIIAKTTDRLNKLIDKLAKADEENSNENSNGGNRKTVEEKIDHVTNATTKHKEVLEKNLDKVPDPARAAIEKAIVKSSTGTEKASGAVSKPKPDEPTTPPASGSSPSNQTKPVDLSPRDK